jgi:hypothetical protein
VRDWDGILCYVFFIYLSGGCLEALVRIDRGKQYRMSFLNLELRSQRISVRSRSRSEFLLLQLTRKFCSLTGDKLYNIILAQILRTTWLDGTVAFEHFLSTSSISFSNCRLRLDNRKRKSAATRDSRDPCVPISVAIDNHDLSSLRTTNLSKYHEPCLPRMIKILHYPKE